MDTQPGTLHTLARHLVLALAPLKDAVADLPAFRTLLYRLAWDVKSLPPEYTALAAKVDRTLAVLDGLGDNPTPAQIFDVLNEAKALYTALKGITNAPEGVDPAVFFEEIGRSLFDLLLVDYLVEEFPSVHSALLALGVITQEFTVETSTRPGVLLSRVRWEEVPKILTDPGSIPSRVYGWGTDDFDFHRLAGHLLEIFVALNWPAYLGRVDKELGHGFMDSPDDAVRTIEWGLKLPVLLDNIGGKEIEVGLALLELPPQGGKHAGLILQPLVPPEIGTSYDITDTLKLQLRAGSDVAQTFGLLLRPDGIFVKFPFQQGAALPQAGFGVTLNYAPPGPALLLGDASSSRLSMQGSAASMELDTHQDGVELKGSLALNGLSVVVATKDQDGFLHTLIGGRDVEVPIPLTVLWSSRSGLSFSGGAGFTLTQSIDRSLGPVTVQTLQLAVRSATDTAHPPDLIVETGVSIGAQIGPVAVAVSNVGVHLTVAFQDGNAGPFDIDVGFMPPDGAGLVVDAAGVTGGGFLRHDAAKHEYNGMLQLQFIELALQAFGLITTEVAGGAGYSLLAIVDAEFPPIQLGWGFTLEGVGGLLAVHRTASTDAMHAALKAGQLSSVLFPKNAITNAPAILAQLDALFPTAPGRFLFGPMALIGWGKPRMLKAAIAVVVELPEPIRVILLARIEARLPNESNPLVRINMDALGVLDLGQDELSFDALLFDSKLIDFTMSGAMALRATWADPSHRGFLLAIGGVHPRFTPPPGFPELQRITIDMPSGHISKLRLAAYLAQSSNSIQLGANLDFFLGVSGFGVAGHLGFDALLGIRPFRFDSDISGKVAITTGGDDLASVQLEGTFSGPKPYHLAGKFSIHLVFFDVGVSFNYSWGGDLLSLPDLLIDVADLLTTELADVRNWDALLPPGVSALVSARRIDDAAILLAHPLARPQVHQRAVPLGLAITRFGEAVPSGATIFTITALRVGRGVIAHDPIQDDFAPAQFFALTDDEKLARPSFERHDAGTRAAAGGVTSGAPFTKTVAYETFFVDHPGGALRTDPGVVVTPPLLSDLFVVMQFGSAGRAASRSNGGRYHAAGKPIRVAEPAFMLADKITLDASDVGRAAGTTFSDMHALLGGRRNLQIVGTHEITAN
jgi:hypothetical protein